MIARWLWLIALLFQPVATFAATQPDAATAQAAGPTTLLLSEVLKEHTRLQEARDVQAAYRWLMRYETRYAGDVDFDMALGLAALQANDAPRAIFAFERVLAVEPGHLRARAELARAYAQTKELDAATRELNQVAQQDLPPAVRQTIQRFLSAIQVQQQGGADGQNHWGASLEIGPGYDSNANLGSSNSTWVGEGGLTLYPSAALLAQSSAFVQANLNLSHSRQLNDRSSWSNGISIGHVWNMSGNESTITRNFGTFDARSGIAYRADSQEWSLTMLAQHIRQDNATHRNAVGLNAQWLRELGKHRIASYVQSFEFWHPGASQRNARRDMVGLSLATSPNNRLVLVANGSVGKQTAHESAQFGMSLGQIRFSLEYMVNQSLRVLSSIGAERRNYAAVDPLFGSQKRVDQEFDTKIALQWDLDRQWSVTPSLALTRNTSKVSAYEFRRHQFFLFARYRF